MMQPDPQRQWFVYFREKEMGPLTETEVGAKLKAGELDSSAYLFTEGMTDWTPVDDLPVFRASGSASAAAASIVPTPTKAAEKSSSIVDKTIEKKAVEKPKTEEARQASEPTMAPVSPSVTAAPVASSSVSAKTPTAASSAPKKTRPVFVAALVAAIAAAGVYYWMDQMPEAPPPPPPKPVETAPVAAVPPPPAAFDWSDLLAARQSRDLKDSAFRISSKPLGGDRPVIVGAVSPLLETRAIWVMVYPDNLKNLLPVMKVWTFRVPVIDGLFSVGPLHIEGQPLPPGTYHVIAAMDGKNLGRVGFDHGVWPTPEQVAEMQAKLAQERSVFAQKEKATLEQKSQEIAEALTQLESQSGKANLGPKGRKEWKASSDNWERNFRGRMAEQREVLMGPMFYPEMQSKLYDFMAEAYKLYSAMEEVSAKGPKAFAAKDKKGLGGRWVEVRKLQETLAGEIRVLGDSAVQQLKIDEETLSRQLLELSQQP
jgi:hypothetical protein